MAEARLLRVNENEFLLGYRYAAGVRPGAAEGANGTWVVNPGAPF